MPRRKLLRAALVAAVAALVVPVSYSTAKGFQISGACAGTCCVEINSYCSAYGSSTFDYYFTVGGCRIIESPSGPLPKAP